MKKGVEGKEVGTNAGPDKTELPPEAEPPRTRCHGMFFETYCSKHSPHRGAPAGSRMWACVPGSSRCQNLPEGQITHQAGSLECGLVASELALSHLPAAEESGGVKLSGKAVGS